MANKCLLAALLLVATTSCTLVGAWQDSALFAELDDDALTIEQIERILGSAKEDAEVGSTNAKHILALKDAHLADCEKDTLQDYVHLSDQVHYNKGAIKYIESKLRPLIELCAKSLNAIKAEHAAQFDQTVREYIEGLASAVMKISRKSPEELKYGQSAKAIEEFIASLPGKKETVKEAQRAQLLEACRHLIGLLDTLALVEAEAEKRDIGIELDRDASWDSAHMACRELIRQSDQVDQSSERRHAWRRRG